ncbi:MAG: PilZ domain-containing protein [Planctomycetota bacterium]|nr:MAG: PilZ domain-containing protein [Planctomycetota bacterium]
MSESVQQSETAVEQSTAQERRRRPRSNFPYRQRIAPVVSGRLPSPSQFFEVNCKDVSTGGFAFVLEYRPEFEELVVALGLPGEETYISAQVAYVRPLEEDSEKFLIGCRFVQREQEKYARPTADPG